MHATYRSSTLALEHALKVLDAAEDVIVPMCPAEVDDWLGYEAAHPLTWIPGADTSRQWTLFD